MKEGERGKEKDEIYVEDEGEGDTESEEGAIGRNIGDRRR